MKVKSYRDLDIWKLGIQIVDCVYTITKRFPNDEKFGLASQMQRAAVSIPANIAEGHARQYKKEFIQFCYIALGSVAEVETMLIISKQRDLVKKDFFEELEGKLDHEGRMIRRLLQRLKS